MKSTASIDDSRQIDTCRGNIVCSSRELMAIRHWCFLIVLLSTSLPLVGQAHAVVTFNQPVHTYALPVALREKLNYIQRTSWPQLSDTIGLRVITSARSVYSEYFRIEPTELLGAVTMVRAGEDVLLARWRADHPSQGINGIFLWDEPTFTSYVFQVDPHVLQNSARLEQLMDDLVAWPNVDRQRRTFQRADAPLRSIRVSLSWNRDTGEISGATPDWGLSILSSFAQYYRETFTMETYGTAQSAYLDFTIGKRLPRSRYPNDMAWIAERFPPLRERVKDWTADHLLNEIGKGGRTAMLSEPGERDELLLQELLRRNLTSEDFSALLDRPMPNSAINPAQIVCTATRAGQGGQFESVIRHLLQEVQDGRKHWQGLSYAPEFGQIARCMRNVADVDLTQTVLAYLKSADFRLAESGMEELWYLQERIQRPEDYRALRELSMPEKLKQIREWAIEKIRVRLNLREDDQIAPPR